MTASAERGHGSRLARFLDWLTRPSGKGKRRYDYGRHDDYAEYRAPVPRAIRAWQVGEAPAGGPRAAGHEELPDGALDATHGGIEWAGAAAARGAGAGEAASLDATHVTTAWSSAVVGAGTAAQGAPDALWRPAPETQATAPPAPLFPPTPPTTPSTATAPTAPPPGPPTPPPATPAPRTLPPMADTGSTAHPARRILAEWPILLTLGGVAFGMSLALGDKDNLLSGTFVIGMTLLLAAALRLFLPTRTAGSLAIRRKAIDVAMYTMLGLVMVALGLLVQGIFGGSGSL